MKLFFDTRPASDEYLGHAIGLFLFRFCVLGLYLWSWRERKSLFIGLIILNHAFGVWTGEDARG